MTCHNLLRILLLNTRSTHREIKRASDQPHPVSASRKHENEMLIKTSLLPILLFVYPICVGEGELSPRVFAVIFPTFQWVIGYCQPSNETRKRHSFREREDIINRLSLRCTRNGTLMESPENSACKCVKPLLPSREGPPAQPPSFLIPHPSSLIPHGVFLTKRATSAARNIERSWEKRETSLLAEDVHIHLHSSSYEYFTSATLTSEPSGRGSSTNRREHLGTTDERLRRVIVTRSISFRSKSRHDLRQLYIYAKWI